MMLASMAEREQGRIVRCKDITFIIIYWDNFSVPNRGAMGRNFVGVVTK